MAAIKLKKYPKKPKASASLQTLNNYLQRCKEIDKENAQKKSDAKKREEALKKVKTLKRN